MFDPRLVDKFQNYHKNIYDNPDSDEDDILQSNNIADENITYLEEYEEEMVEIPNPRRKDLNKYVNQHSGSKFNH